MVMGSGEYRTGTIMPFSLPGALAAGFPARKRGTPGTLALGFAVPVFLFPWTFLMPMISFMPNPEQFPLKWIVWSLTTDIAVVVMASLAGASIERWAGWAKEVGGKLYR